MLSEVVYAEKEKAACTTAFNNERITVMEFHS